jgi:hypothetical protein
MVRSAGRLEDELRQAGGLSAPAEITGAKEGLWRRSSGALTDAEFEAEKKRVLGG